MYRKNLARHMAVKHTDQVRLKKKVFVAKPDPFLLIVSIAQPLRTFVAIRIRLYFAK